MQTMDTVSDQAYQYSRSLRGVPSDHNRTVRATGDCWQRGLRMRHTVGTAFEGETPMLTDDGRATVKVIKDGITSYVPASSFGRKSTKGSQRQAARKVAEVSRLQPSKRDAEAMAQGIA